MKDYAGFYGNFMGVSKVEITDAGKLLITSTAVPGTPAEEYTYTGNGGFTDEAGRQRVSFVKEGVMTYIRKDQYHNQPEMGAVLATAQYDMQKLESNTLDSATADEWANREGQMYLI